LDYLCARSPEENRRLVTVLNTAQEACKDSHPVAILADCNEFKELDWKGIYNNMLKPAFCLIGEDC